jgi:hypothetical protein
LGVGWELELGAWSLGFDIVSTQASNAISTG